MKKEMLYLIPAILLLSGCGKSVSISINTNKNESTVSESNDINESKETEITRDNKQTDVEMFDATVYYKPKDGYEPPENVIPQIKTDNKNLDSVVERINSTWTNDYSNIQLTRADSNVFSLLIDTVTFDNNNSSKELRGVNINSSTGKELKITDILKDADALYDKLMNDKDFIDNYDDIDNFGEKMKSVLTEPDDFSDGENINKDATWSLSNGAMMIYMLEDTKNGKQTVSIPVDYIKYKEFFKDGILDLPDDYAFKIIVDNEMNANINGKESVSRRTK